MKKLLKDKEAEILKLVETDERYKLAYQVVQFFYIIGYELNKSNGNEVFKRIYVEKVDVEQWQKAILCNMSRTTFFEYRHEIINCFEVCIKIIDKIRGVGNLVEMIAVTKDLYDNPNE